MKRVIFLVFLIWSFNYVLGEKIGVLSDVYHPQLIKVIDNDIFVVEGNKIFVFSSKDLTLKKKFDKEGNGPGEFKLDRNRSAAISLFPDMIVVESRFKVVFFDREFSFLKEMKKMPGIVQTVPFGRNYIVHKILYGPEGENYFTLNLYDTDMKMILEFYRQKFFAFKGKTNVVPDGINFCVLNNNIYVEKSEEGPLIDIFNDNGTLLKTIRLDEKKIFLSSEDRDTALDHYLSIPALFAAVKQRGKKEIVKELKNNGGLRYPDYFPSFRDIKSDGEFLYVKTSVCINGTDKYYVLDQDGNILRVKFLPNVRREAYFDILQGDKKFYAFNRSYFYYLKESVSDDEEVWEVHREKIVK